MVTTQAVNSITEKTAGFYVQRLEFKKIAVRTCAHCSQNQHFLIF